MPERLAIADFAGHLGASFPVGLPSGEAVELVLLEAKALGRHEAPAEGREPFSLIFRGPDRPALSQQIHSLGHPTLGPLDVFLVPIGPERGRDGLRYQAIFN